MNRAQLEWRDYAYFPYEREFACLEVERLFQACPIENGSGMSIPAGSYRRDRAERLTYFARAIGPDGHVTVPRQVRLEASAHAKERQGQATRYSAHCLHEYKGRFNPQVVRAIANILGVTDGQTILDPFCGSGTTLLEAVHAGWSAFGVDRNPLAVRIANAKLDAFRTGDGELEESAANTIRALDAAQGLSGAAELTDSEIQEVVGARWEQDLPAFEYLLSWFSISVLAQIVAIRRAVNGQCSSAIARIFEIILSDQLREASYQEPLDLRIRRRKDPAPNYPIVKRFTKSLEEKIDRISRARRAVGVVCGQQKAIFGDIRSLDLARADGVPKAGFETVITSPPYETALPYIDTQRLSLVLFGDVRSTDIHRTERDLIGAREIGPRERAELELVIRMGDRSLPAPVNDLCRKILAATKLPGNGFRRMNRPALVYRYFRGMSDFFLNLKRCLRPGARLALVVGTNRTTVGGREFSIETPDLLALVAQHIGYEVIETRAMETYARYDLHQRNSITSEKLLLLSYNGN